MNLMDTPNSLVAADFEVIGSRTEGFSGSDLSIVARDALMEPLRVCQHAKQFQPVVVGGKQMLQPCVKYPMCPHCPMKLAGTSPEVVARPCTRCFAMRMSLYDVQSDALHVPVVDRAMIAMVLERARPSVNPKDLEQFAKWTADFGQDA